MAANQFLGRRGRPKVPGESNEIAAGFGLERADRLLDAGRRAARDDDARAFPREARRDGGANPGGAARHQRLFAFEFEIHVGSLRESGSLGRQASAIKIVIRAHRRNRR